MKLKIGTGIVLLMAVNGWAAEPVTGIGFLLVNPSAVHRKIVKLEGVAKNVVVHAGSELATKQSLCGADSNSKIAVEPLPCCIAPDVKSERCAQPW